MSVHEHKHKAKRSVACAVVTISDTRDLSVDGSGQSIVALLEAAGHVVRVRELVRDDVIDIRSLVRALCARTDVDAVITTGGTGVSARDNTYEAVGSLFDRRLDGFGELFRYLSYADVGPAAMLSRATAGIIERTPVFVLPGSTAACTLAMEKLIVPELGHVVTLASTTGAQEPSA